MFGKTRTDTTDARGAESAPQFQRSVAASPTASDQPEASSIIGPGMSIVGKIASDGAINVFGRVDGELRASTVMISGGAQVEGDIVAEDLTIGGRVKGTIHANRVKLNGTAVVEGDIFHRSLAIEENARFEGTSRREENAIDTPSRAQMGRPQSQAAASDGSRKLNGAPEGRSNPPTAELVSPVTK